MEFMSFFNDTLYQYMVKEGITVNQLSGRLGVSHVAIKDWLDCKYYPTLSYSLIVARFFNCSLSYLFGLNDNSTLIKNDRQASFKERFELLLKLSADSNNSLARKIHVGASIVGKWRNKNVTPKIENFISLSKYFNCSLDYLVGLSDVR